MRSAPADLGDLRLGLDRVDELHLHAVLATVQHVHDLVDVAELRHRLVGDDRDALDAAHVGEVADRVRLEVGLRGILNHCRLLLRRPMRLTFKRFTAETLLETEL
jgi:hypothetical protein